MRKALIERRLSEVAAEMRRVQEELRISSEQLEHLESDADEARIRSLVSETPMSEQEYQDAVRHAQAMRRHHEELRDRLSELESRQDELLDRMSGS